MRLRPSLMLSASLSASLLASCTVGPDYARPESAVADQWLEPASSAPIDGTWWKQFDDPLLTELIERALADSPDIRQATARVAEARAMREAVQGGRRPQAVGSGSATQNRMSENGQIPVGSIPGFDPEFPLIDAGFDASWEIDLWGRQSRQVEQARAREDAAGWARRDAIVSLTAEIARTYVEFRLVEDDLASARTELDAAVVQERMSGLLRKAGEATAIDLQKAGANMQLRQGVLNRAEADHRAAAYRLATLVGAAPEEMVPDLLGTSGAIPEPPAEIAQGIRSDLLERRPDIRLAERELAAVTAGIGVATADLYPHLTLMGSVGLQSQETGDFLQGESLRYSVGPSFQWPIFSFGRIRAQIRAADARADAGAAAYEAAVVKALNETEASANGFAASSAAAQAAEDALQRQQRSFELEQMLFERGETNLLQLEEARLNLVSVKRQAAQARASRASAAVSLYKALGGGWAVP